MLKRILLSLALTITLACLSSAATIDQLTGGQFQLPDGTPCAGCYLYLVLSSDATITGTAQVISGGSPRKFLLDANGSVVAGAQIWGNDQLSPANTYYIATVTYPNGGLLMKPQAWSLIGTSPINLTGMTATVPSPLSFPSPVLTGANNNFTGLNTFTQIIQGTITNAQTAATAATASVANTLLLLPSTFAALPPSSNGTLIYCSDCITANPCASGGTGTVAARFNGAWNCGNPSVSTFSGLGGGTNTGAAMVVGTGASLAASGSGTIAATSAPFAGVNAGTNANALVVGTGGSLATSGTGTITATNGVSFVSSIPATCTPGTTQPVTLSVAPYGVFVCVATNVWSSTIFGSNAIYGVNYGIQPGYFAGDASFTNGSGAVVITAQDAQFTSAMNGWSCFGTTLNTSGAVNPLINVAYIPFAIGMTKGTLTFTNATHATCSTTWTPATAVGTFIYWPADQATNLANAWTAASASADGICRPLILPATGGNGVIMTSTGQFNSATCKTGTPSPPDVGLSISGGGGGPITTNIGLDPGFSFSHSTSCTGNSFSGAGSNFACFAGINAVPISNITIMGFGNDATSAPANTVMVALGGDGSLGWPSNVNCTHIGASDANLTGMALAGAYGDNITNVSCGSTGLLVLNGATSRSFSCCGLNTAVQVAANGDWTDFRGGYLPTGSSTVPGFVVQTANPSTARLFGTEIGILGNAKNSQGLTCNGKCDLYDTLFFSFGSFQAGGSVSSAGVGDGTHAATLSAVNSTFIHVTNGNSVALNASAVFITPENDNNTYDTPVAPGSGTFKHHEKSTCVFAASTTCTVTFANPFGAVPIVTITPYNPGATTFTIGTPTSTGFTITGSGSSSITVAWNATL